VSSRAPGYFPFHRLGYACNPFRVLSEEEWAAVAVVPDVVEVVLARADTLHLQVLGEAGRGKSTTLVALAARFRASGLAVASEYLPEGRSRLGTDPAHASLDVFCLDEAQRLSSRARRRLLGAAVRRPGLRLVLGSHEDLGSLFAARGLPLAAVRLDAGSRAHLTAILERRLEHFTRWRNTHEDGPAQPVTLNDAALDWLWSNFGSDGRGAERLLYEAFQRLAEADAITFPQVTAAYLAETREALTTRHPQQTPPPPA